MRLIEEISDVPSEPEGPSVAATRAVNEALSRRAVPGQAPEARDGLDCDWSEPKGLTDAETQQMAHLREKYASHVVGRGVVPDGAGDADADATEARLKAAQARMDAEFLARPAAAASTTGSERSSTPKIRVCEACKGERSIKHEYNHRVMERMCETCDGEGVLMADGARGDDKNKSEEDAANAKITDDSSSPFAPGDGQRRRLAVLLRDAKRLDLQIAKYRDEMHAVQQRLDVDLEIPAGEEQALAEVAHQLQKHVSRLLEKADLMRAEAATLRGPEDEEDDLERDAEDLP